MVLIQVPGQDGPYYLSENDVEGSKTIEHLRQYNVSHGLHQPIDVLVPLVDWQQYIQFLHNGNPTIGTLKVIDYLDNLGQAKTWFWKRYESSIKLYNDDDHNEGKTEDQIIDIIDNNTQFTWDELFPILSCCMKEDMSQYLSVPYLPQFYIRHILWDEYYDCYRNIDEFLKLSDVPEPLLQDLSSQFIIKHVNGQDVKTKSKIHTSSEKTINKARHIEHYVAQYYQNIRVYKPLYPLCPIMCKNTLLIGPHNEPYLVGYKPKNGFITIGFKEDYIWTDNSQLERYSPVNVYNPNSPYKPYTGYNTGLTDDGYNIYSYNLPTTDGRDYYLFFRILDDPVSMLRYVISI